MHTPSPNPVLPEYCCRRISSAPVMDGRLSDPAWQTADVAALLRADTGQPGRYRTTVRLLYDEACLFVGFQCEDTYVWGTYRERDAEIYTEECVEVFISPAGGMHQYYEINVSPLNTVFDACILNRRTQDGPAASRPVFLGLSQYDTPGLRTATAVDGELNRPGGARAWSAEYAIPFHALIGAPRVPPVPGDRWRANFFRIDAPAESSPEYYAWSPTGIIDFHIPQRFGTLVFVS